MAGSAIEIASTANSLLECSPNLMPFHIKYSGPAPIATYFRVTHTTLLSDHDATSQTTVLDSPQTSDPAIAFDIIPAADISVGTVPPAAAQTVHTRKNSSFGARFKAAFRGRGMQGVTVNLPEGYGGIILRGPANSGTRGKGKGVVDNVSKERETTSKSKRGRASRKGAQIEVDDHHDIPTEESQDDVDQEPVRRLMPTGTFSSFVLWSPDGPVDEARDEYLRSLTEWTTLAAEIHRMEDY